MEQTQTQGDGMIGAIISAGFAFIAWISAKDAQVGAAIIASILACGAAIFSIRASYFTIKEKKKSIEKLNQKL